MLFTDGTVLTIAELREHDNLVLDVASTEGIELSSKLSIAQREIGYEISSFLMSRGVGLGLDNVVVTEQLKDLLADHTLASVYRDAYNTHLNDRYLGRWREFAKASERGLMRYLYNGVGVTSISIRRAEKPSVSTSALGDLPAGTYYVQIAWQHLAGNVSERNAPVLMDVAGGSITVTPPSAPANALGWHVFIGTSEGVVRRQNDSAISPMSSWTQAVTLRSDLSGVEPSGPDYYVRGAGQLNRG